MWRGRNSGNARQSASRGGALTRRRLARRNAQAGNAFLGARVLVRRAIRVAQAVAQRRRARASKRRDGLGVRVVFGVAKLVHRRRLIAKGLLHANLVLGEPRLRRLNRRLRQPFAITQASCERRAEEKRGEGGREGGGKSARGVGVAASLCGHAPIPSARARARASTHRMCTQAARSRLPGAKAPQPGGAGAIAEPPTPAPPPPRAALPSSVSVTGDDRLRAPSDGQPRRKAPTTSWQISQLMPPRPNAREASRQLNNARIRRR